MKNGAFLSKNLAQILHKSCTYISQKGAWLCKFYAMATISLYLDSRRSEIDKAANVKISIHSNKTTVFISTPVSVPQSQWDNVACRVINHPRSIEMNIILDRLKSDAEMVLLSIIRSNEPQLMTAQSIKQRVIAELFPSESYEKSKLFVTRFERFASMKSESTKALYMHTLSKLRSFVPKTIDTLRFEDITKGWLMEFEAYLAKTAPSKNARNIHLRNIRAVFNDAIDDEITAAYPFRRFKIRPVATAKRSLSVERLRELFNYPCEEYQRSHVDIFKLIFFLCGINIVDLCRLREIIDGRIEYNRAKTHKHYSIKVEPEAMEIIERHRGESWLLDILDRYNNYQDYLKRINRSLQKIGEMERIGRGGKKVITSAFPGLTTYWARHTWATIAASLDIPKETIAAGLGHGGDTVTDIYINFDMKKVDKANRRIIDYVLYDKR